MKYIKIFVMMWLSTISYAQNNQLIDTTKTIELQEVIIKSDGKKNPAQTIVKSDYKEKVVQPKNTGELFQDINGFSLIKRGNYAVDPSFRATQYEQLNVQYDGGTRAFHACPNRMDPITTLINPEEVTRIEIIKGPFSVRYGANFGGVINMVTSSGSQSNSKLEGSYSSGYETNGSSSVNILSLMSKVKNLHVAANISHRDYGNYKDGNQNEIPSSFRNLGYGLKVGYAFNDKNSIQFSVRQNFGRDILHAGLPMDTDYDNSSILSFDYALKVNQKHLKNVNTKLYYSFVDHLMSNTRRKNFSMMEAFSPVDATTYGGKIETEWDFGEKWKLFSGIDMVNLSRDGHRNRLVKRNMMGNLLPNPMSFTDKIWQDSHNNTLGTFAEAKFYASSNTTFTFGARLDIVNSGIRDIEPKFLALYQDLKDRHETNISSHVSFKHAFSNNKTLEISFGRGARSANIEERYIAFFNIGRDPYEYIGNPNLKAEINNQFEISYNGLKILDIKNIQKLKYGTSLYYSIYENYIMGVVDESLIRTFNPTTPPIHPKVFRNINDAFRTGFEAFVEIEFYNYFKFKTDIAYVYTKNNDFNESLPLTPPLTTRFKLEYEKQKFWVNLQYNVTSKQTKISQSFDEIETAAYQTLDLKTGFEPFKNFNIGAGILNIFDQYYNNHLTFAFNNQSDFGRTPITEPGRNFTLFLNYKF